VAVRYGLVFAHCWAGRLRETLSVANEVLELAQGNQELGADQVGLSPVLGVSLYKGVALSLRGRPRDGRAEIDHVIDLAPVSQQLFLLWIAHGLQFYRYEVTGETASALAHAREAVSYAEQSGSNQGRAFAYSSLGRASVLSGAWHDALEVLGQALAISRGRRLSGVESTVLAAMAAAHTGLDDCPKALALAEEAIAMSRRRNTRLPEFWAQLTRMRALREMHGVNG
jgi:tetratricopeptide (TPR) repeat protein